jgi:hypothetical protein
MNEGVATMPLVPLNTFLDRRTAKKKATAVRYQPTGPSKNKGFMRGIARADARNFLKPGEHECIPGLCQGSTLDCIVNSPKAEDLSLWNVRIRVP